MKVDTIIEGLDGSIKFEGELTKEETELVVNLGLNFLVQSGAFNIIERPAQKDIH